MAEYIFIFKNSEMIRLQKGMTSDEVKGMLGNSYEIEACKDAADQKWIFEFSGNHGKYKLLFRNNLLEWMIRGTFSKTNQMNLLNTEAKPAKRKKQLTKS